MTALEYVTEIVEANGGRIDARGMTCCWAHADTRPSLHISQGEKGVVFHCFAGCDSSRIIAGLPFEPQKLFADFWERANGHAAAPPPRAPVEPVKVEVLGPLTAAQIETLRNQRRVLKQETIDGLELVNVQVYGAQWIGIGAVAEGEGKLWAIGVDGVRRCEGGKLVRRNVGPGSLILSPALRAAGPKIELLYDVEGESDLIAAVDAGIAHVLTGTTGASSTSGHERHRDVLEKLELKVVVVVADVDQAGLHGAEKRAAWWRGQGKITRIVELPQELGEHGDLRDYLNGRAGGDEAPATEPMGDAVDLDHLAERAEPRFAEPELDDDDPEPLLEDEDAPPANDETEAPNDRTAGLHLLSAAEFDDDVAPDALIEGMIYRASVTTLNGASKVGKSFFAYQAAMALASGSTFLGLETVPTTVLLVSLELSAGSVRKRMQAIADATGLPMPKIGNRFHIVAPTRERAVALDLAKDAGCAVLAETIRENGIELVILDTLYRFCPGLDPSSNAEMGELFGHLNYLAHETGCALLVLDHAAKGEQFGPAAHSGIGAQAKGGSAASIISIRSTARADGGKWQVDVDSWFGSWDEPLYYERPKLHTGERGAGCVRCGAAEAFSFTYERLGALFRDHAERDATGRPRFPSKRAFTDALVVAGHASGNGTSEQIISAITRDFCRGHGSSVGRDRPVEIETHGTSKTSPTSFTWCHKIPDPAQPEMPQ